MFMPVRISEDNQEILERMDAEERKKLVKDFVHAIIVLGQRKNIIKRSEVNKFLVSHRYRQNNAILNEGCHDLYKFFGLRLFEVNRASVSDSRLLLVNASTTYTDYAINIAPSTCEESTVLFFILMGIFASVDDRMSEAEIVKILSPLDLSATQMKDYIELFIKQLYLDQNKESLQHEEKTFSWGPRAIAEIEPDKFMDSFLDLVGQGTAQDWPEQIRRIDKLKLIPNRVV